MLFIIVYQTLKNGTVTATVTGKRRKNSEPVVLPYHPSGQQTLPYSVLKTGTCSTARVSTFSQSVESLSVGAYVRRKVAV